LPHSPVIWGTSGPDTIHRNARSRCRDCFARNDIVRAGAGKDDVCAGKGSDVISWETGADDLTGDQGRDLIHYCPERYRLRSGAGRDTLDGGAGPDGLDTAGGTDGDRMFGEGGMDVCGARKNDGVDFCDGGPPTASDDPDICYSEVERNSGLQVSVRLTASNARSRTG
jgi:Ca2+-binding RTX toxin-like protein